MSRSKYIFKISLLMICIAFSQQTLANELLKCLGKEEWHIHQKKLSGPLYKLNQTFINAVAGTSDIDIKKIYLDKICNSTQNSTSVIFLSTALINGTTIYKIKKTDDKKKTAIQASNIENFNNKLPLIFFDYLSQLQSLTTYPHCLKESIPEIKYYLERYKYLQSELSAVKLMRNKKKIKAIFTKLNNFERYVKKCNKKQKKLDDKTKA